MQLLTPLFVGKVVVLLAMSALAKRKSTDGGAYSAAVLLSGQACLPGVAKISFCDPDELSRGSSEGQEAPALRERLTGGAAWGGGCSPGGGRVLHVVHNVVDHAVAGIDAVAGVDVGDLVVIVHNGVAPIVDVVDVLDVVDCVVDVVDIVDHACRATNLSGPLNWSDNHIGQVHVPMQSLVARSMIPSLAHPSK